MGMFKDLAAASSGYQSNPLRPGRYVARIDNMVTFDAEQKGWFWKTTLTILAIEDGGESPHKIGEQVHVFFKKGQYPQVFLQNIKSLIAGVLNVADEEVGEAEAEAVLSEEGGEPGQMDGLVTTVTGRQQASKKSKDDDGNPRLYTVYGWGPSLDDAAIVEAMTEEDFAKIYPNGL